MSDFKIYTDEETAAILKQEAEAAKVGKTPEVAPAAAEPIKEVTPAEPAPILAAATPDQNAHPEPKAILGEEYASWDQVKSSLTRAKELESKNKELEDKVKEYTPVDPYVAELNKARQKGISKEAFDQFYSSDPEKLSPEEKISMHMQLRDGVTKEQADFLVNKKYGTDEYEPGSDEVKAIEIDKSIAVRLAEKEIAAIRTDLMVSPLEKAVEARVKEFEPIVPTILNEISTLGEGELAYKVPKETIDLVNDNLKAMISSEVFDMDRATPENIAKLKTMAMNLVKGMEHDNHVRHVKNEMEKKQLEEKVNPRPTTGEKPPPAKISAKEEQMAWAELVNKHG